MATSRPRRATIRDVAARAGVSTAAASKVLRNAYGVSPQMQTRVRAAMAELGYRPQAGARGMRGRTYTVGVVVDRIGNPFFAEIVEGVALELQPTDYQVLLGPGGYSDEEQVKLVEAMVDRGMDGLVLVAPTMTRPHVAETAAAVPTVVVGHHDTAAEFDSVVDDDMAGAALVVDHLVALGHRRIAHTSSGGNVRNLWLDTPEKVRADGYRAAMRSHGLDAFVDVVSTSYDDEGGYLATRELLARSPRPTAVFAGCDVAALGALRAVTEAGLSVPGDLSLVGYDNTELAALAPVQLTTVDQPGTLMGRAAGRLLLERLAGRTESALVSVAPTLVPRGTTAPPTN